MTHCGVAKHHAPRFVRAARENADFTVDNADYPWYQERIFTHTSGDGTTLSKRSYVHNSSCICSDMLCHVGRVGLVVPSCCQGRRTHSKRSAYFVASIGRQISTCRQLTYDTPMWWVSRWATAAGSETSASALQVARGWSGYAYDGATLEESSGLMAYVDGVHLSSTVIVTDPRSVRSPSGKLSGLRYSTDTIIVSCGALAGSGSAFGSL